MANVLQIPSTYRGFTSVGVVTPRQIARTGVDLIKIDLLNQFYTSPGENKMRPLWGCRIKQMLYEQYGSTDRRDLIAEVMNVINAEPRVTYISSTITDIAYGIVIAIQLEFNEFAVVDTLIATFNMNTDGLYGF